MFKACPPRFGLIKAHTSVSNDSGQETVKYHITFETPKDIGDADTFLKIHPDIAKNPALLTRGNLDVVIEAGLSQDDPFLNLTYNNKTAYGNPDTTIDSDSNMGEQTFHSLHRLAGHLPLSLPYQQFLVMAAHNFIGPWINEAPIELPQAARLAKVIKRELLTRDYEATAQNTARLQEELLASQAKERQLAASIEDLGRELAQPT